MRARTYRDLRVWRGAFAAAMEVYRLTRGFPASERFTLTDQAVRSSRSVCANLAEAWRKRRYPAAFVAKLSDAEAEAAETRCHLEFAHACGYLTDQQAADLDARYDTILAQIVRMIASPSSFAIGRQSGSHPQKQRTPSSPSPPPPGGAGKRAESPRTKGARNRPPLSQRPAGRGGAATEDPG